MGTAPGNRSIVSDIAPDTRLRLTFETLVCRLFPDILLCWPNDNGEFVGDDFDRVQPLSPEPVAHHLRRLPGMLIAVISWCYKPSSHTHPAPDTGSDTQQ